MVTKNLYFIVKKLSLILCLTACAQMQRPSKQQPVEPAKQVEEKTQKPIALIFGPGGLKTYAHIGVVKNLERENIEINRIIGIEWGAVIGSVYARKAKIHDLEWQMSKLKSEHLPNAGFFKNNIDLENPNRLNLFFERIFPGYDLAQSKIPFACATKSTNKSAASWLQSGPAFKDLKKCVAYPPLFYSYNTWHADTLSIKDAIAKLRSEGDYHIVLVNVIANDTFRTSKKVIDQEAEKILWQEVRDRLEEAAKEVDTYVAIDTSAESILDLGATKALIKLGQEQSASAVMGMRR